MLDTLRSVTRDDIDDLERLRRMIKKTQKEMTSYAGDTYGLNKLVEKTSKEFGHLDNIHTIKNKITTNFFTLNKHIPDGKTSMLFKK